MKSTPILKAEIDRFLINPGVRGCGEKAEEWGHEREIGQP